MTIKEHIKTAFLWIMIISSVVLTWMLWTYQPAYDELSETEDSYIEIEDIGESKSFTDLLYPSTVISHQEDEEYWVHPSDENYGEMLEAMEDIVLESMRPTGSVHAPNMEQSFVGLELIFDEELNGEWMQYFFDIQEENILVENVDRIVVAESENEDDSDVVVRFVDMDAEEVFEAETSVSLSQLELFNQGNAAERSEVERHLFTEREDSDFQPVLYIPEEAVTKRMYTYETTDISPDGFIQTLFSDPDYVKQYFQEGEDSSYTDGTRMMDMTNGGSILNYVQPDVSGTSQISEESVIRTAQNFVNSHYGWTDEFYATSWSESGVNHSAEFTLHLEGMEIMEVNSGSSAHRQIQLTRSGTEIIEYTRPMFQLDENPFDIDTELELPPYSEIEEHIDAEEAFTADSVENAKIAYYMNRQNSFVVFEPSWFVYSQGQWHRVTLPDMPEQEVLTRGLE
ncbi:YycH family regulatory protein [Alkalicoccus halolimnae]|uniref:Two-component system activity regulator YycH n=1 Tax=Alkalicoccus halolimnae TaxID=1667239 RepID=A0A5C7FBF1_9BACI|nr:two-component system activity regulator YycH [Alkalicoccus halolimnae]TXF86758.1 hypothetical protein FTX54_02200 [Alkalicoccus halolimnae]